MPNYQRKNPRQNASSILAPRGSSVVPVTTTVSSSKEAQMATEAQMAKEARMAEAAQMATEAQMAKEAQVADQRKVRGGASISRLGRFVMREDVVLKVKLV